ncbi:srp receptor beta subunit [Podospora conica]|nr:srp receptor beta subunit [Schizothecium conicum]
MTNHTSPSDPLQLVTIRPDDNGAHHFGQLTELPHHNSHQTKSPDHVLIRGTRTSRLSETSRDIANPRDNTVAPETPSNKEAITTIAATMSILETIKSALEASLQPTTPVIVLGLAFVLLFPFLLHYILHGGPSSTSHLPSILLLGPSGAGKTALLSHLERRAAAPPSEPDAAKNTTHTSQSPLSVELSASDDAKFLLIDTPGHAKLRGHALSHLSPATSKAENLRAVVFVLDAAAIDDDVAAAAGYLYDVLLALQKRAGSGRGSKAPAAVPLLVAANKLDLFTALPAALVKSRLEAELGRIRSTRSRGLLGVGVGADEGAVAEEGDDWLGEYGSEKFTFGQMREFDVEVDVVGGSVVGEGPGADRWWKWIAERV